MLKTGAENYLKLQKVAFHLKKTVRKDGKQRKNHRIRVITASVRTTNRMNALLNESMQSKGGKKPSSLKSLLKKDSIDEEEDEILEPKVKFEYFKTNFTMDHVYKLIENIIEDRLQWDRFNRMYDSWKSVQLAESLAAEIRDRVKQFRHRRHRIICLVSVVEKQHQGIHFKMKYLLDTKMDNFTTFTHERATYNIIATAFLIYKN